MASQQGEVQSGFSARSDRAALSLRKQLQKQYPDADIPDSRTVEVDANGRPPAPLPPEGSYARQAIERQRRQASQRPDPQAGLVDDGEIQMQRQDPQATLQGDQGNQPVDAQPQSSEQGQLSVNAQRRISQLTEDLRRKDQEMQQLLTDSKASKDSLAQLEAKLNGLQQQHTQLLQTSLDNMDPETRTQVLMDGRLAEAVAASEQRIISQIMPQLQKFDRLNFDADMRRLSAAYPGFNLELHAPLIEQFRRHNPKCTVDQAFRAVAEPEELQLAPQVRASAVPPVVQPGNGRIPRQRQETPSPEDEVADETNRWKKLMNSADPADKALRNRATQQLLSNRLGSRLPS